MGDVRREKGKRDDDTRAPPLQFTSRRSWRSKLLRILKMEAVDVKRRRNQETTQNFRLSDWVNGGATN